MSRFADTTTRTVPIGPCECPGKPHEQDEATVRWQLGASALARIGAARLQSSDPYAPHRQLIVEATVSWTLQIEYEGKLLTVPIVDATVAELDSDTLDKLAQAIDDLIENEGQLPNAPGAPSPASPQGSASPTPTRTRKRGM